MATGKLLALAGQITFSVKQSSDISYPACSLLIQPIISNPNHNLESSLAYSIANTFRRELSCRFGSVSSTVQAERNAEPKISNRGLSVGYSSEYVFIILGIILSHVSAIFHSDEW